MVAAAAAVAAAAVGSNSGDGDGNGGGGSSGGGGGGSGGESGKSVCGKKMNPSLLYERRERDLISFFHLLHADWLP